jgi:hypothetical protein
MIFSAAAGENVQLGMDDFAERIRAQRKQDRHCARLFVNAVEGGDADGLLSAIDALNELSVDGWRLAMLGAGRLATTTDEVRAAFLTAWIESKSISLNVGNRPALVRALRVLMPYDYSGPPLRVYRGTRILEHRRRLYGISWTTDRMVAERFANEQERAARRGRDMLDPEAFSYADHRGAILAAVVSSNAVLLKREPEGYYDEAEVVIDPYYLRDVSQSAPPASE